MKWLTNSKKIYSCLSYSQSLLLIGLAALVISISGCGESSESDQKNFGDQTIPADSIRRSEQVIETAKAEFEIDSTIYEDWLEYNYLNITIMYPADHAFASSMDEMARGYDAAIRRNIVFLGLDEFTDPLLVYYYVNNTAGFNSTGSHYPFATKEAVHFWQLYFYGPSLMEYMLYYWQDSEPEYRFLKEGIMAILDYSGNNYHEYTKKYILDSTVIGLDSLGGIPISGPLLRGADKACSASFVDFVAYYFGSGTLKQLYTASGSFETNVEEIFNMSPDSLETLWLGFVDVVIPDTTGN